MLSRILALLMLLLAHPPALAQLPDPAVTHANTVRQGSIAYAEGYFGKGDKRLHYVEAGEGPLVILYHGFPSFWFSFFDQMEVLKTRYRVVAVDGLGAGLSAKPEAAEPYRIDRLATQLDALAKHLNGDQRFILVGHDWGAALAFAYAQAYPKRLRAVIGMSAPPYNLFLDLVRTNTEQQQRSQYMQVFRGLTLPSIASSGLPERLWQQSYGGLIQSGALSAEEGALFRAALADPRAVHGGMNWYRANVQDFGDAGRAFRWPTKHRKIRVPSLLIWGEADKTFVEKFLTQIGDYAPGILIIRQPGVGHWTSMEKPALANEGISAFFSAIEKAPNRR